ncbi:MAG TPA: rod shape-determining protein MreD [Clostridiales bacterium]|nr:rod shape-determining protein MreD [Clostridiales bacterium]
MPNMFIILVLFIGLFYSRIAGVAYGVLFGVLLDFFIGRKIGISGIFLGIVGFIGGVFDKNFSKENKLTIIMMITICTIIYEVSLYLIGGVFYKYSFEVLPFVKILLIECLYNVIMTIILYPIIQNLGYKIEAVYKGDKILTRYF